MCLKSTKLTFGFFHKVALAVFDVAGRYKKAEPDWLVKAIKEKSVKQNPSIIANRPVGLNVQKLPSDVCVRYLYLSGERRRATDQVWSPGAKLVHSVTKLEEPVLYYLFGDAVPAPGFVREELLAVPPDTQLPHGGVVLPTSRPGSHQ